jgi:hypothetical protein
VVHVRLMLVRWRVSVVVLNDLVEEFSELSVSIMRSGVSTDT